jgi:hypothetical protein
MEEPIPGRKYLHFKGKEYEVIAIAKDCEDPARKFVVYKQLYESKTPIGTVWIRSLEDFVGNKEFKEDTDINGRLFRMGERIKKFVLVE